MKIIKIIVIFALGIITHSFIDKRNDLGFIQEPIEQRILGIWIMENSPSDKIEFLPNGQVKRYEDNVLLYIDNYIVTNSCNGSLVEFGDTSIFLKITDSQDGTITCDLINGVDEEKNGMLSLTTSG